MIILSLESACPHHVARDLGHVPRTVMRWYLRAKHMLEDLRGWKGEYSAGEIKRLLLATVEDAPRPGAPLKYTPEQQCALVALAVRKPMDLGVPVENWTHRELAIVADMELIGIPHRVVIGDRALAEGNVEYKSRRGEESQLVARDDILEFLLGQIHQD